MNLCKELEDTKGINAEYMLIDLEKKDELKIVEDRIKKTPNLEILVNNAGYGEGNRRIGRRRGRSPAAG